MTPVRYHPDAVSELNEARQWYRGRSEVVAQAFILELSRSIDEISLSPETWPKVHDQLRRYRLPRFPYSIVYRIEHGTVFVTAIAHQRRRFGYWKDR